ncbi:MAG: tetratricopeptide repeat protein [Nitrospirae bacterium]|nr:MAG: tetratricopeptide repeat protein [Nitrospirota bacterium]
MSLIADLLSKIKREEVNNKADVPPALRRTVVSASKSTKMRNRIVLFAALVCFSVAAGYGAVFLLNQYVKPLKIPENIYAKKDADSQPKTQEPSPAPVIPVQQPVQKVAESLPKAAVQPEAPKPAPLPVVKPVPQPVVKEQPKPTAVPAPVKKEQPKEQSVKAIAKQLAKEKTDGISAAKKPAAKPVQAKTAKSTKPAMDALVPVAAVMSGKSAQKAAASAVQTPADAPVLASKKEANENRDAYLYTAQTYEARKDYDKAMLNYKKALELDPQNYILMNNAGTAALNKGLYEEAIKYYNSALALKQNYVPSLINLGLAYIRTNKQAEGEAYLTKAVKIEPLNKMALLNLGIFHELKDNYENAANYFAEISRMGDQQGYLGLARVAEKQGKVSEAIRAYKEFLSLPDIDVKGRRMAGERIVKLEQSL